MNFGHLFISCIINFAIDELNDTEKRPSFG